MILELADLRIHSGQNAAFEAAVERGARECISAAAGFVRFNLEKCIENPQRYVLLIQWNTLEDHTIGFRESPAFAQWRTLVGPFFAAVPVVEHFTQVGPTL